MSGKFQTINRDTPYLLPPSIQDCPLDFDAEGNLALMPTHGGKGDE